MNVSPARFKFIISRSNQPTLNRNIIVTILNEIERTLEQYADGVITEDEVARGLKYEISLIEQQHIDQASQEVDQANEAWMKENKASLDSWTKEFNDSLRIHNRL